MKLPLLALLYAAMTLGANPVIAQGLEEDHRNVLIANRTDDMRKMSVHTEARAPIDVAYTDVDGNPLTLRDSDGTIRLVNFWATWCAPCREEMPSLAALRAEHTDGNFEVITIATGRNRISGIETFFVETGISNLPIYLDPKGQLARSMGVLGLPVTVLLDAEGYEIARLTGGADWHGDSAQSWLSILLDDH